MPRLLYCPTCKEFPEYRYVTIPVEDGQEAILVDPEGNPTNNYTDGTAGVTPEHTDLAEAEEICFCFKCSGELDFVEVSQEQYDKAFEPTYDNPWAHQ